jgi:hypothetical protein
MREDRVMGEGTFCIHHGVHHCTMTHGEDRKLEHRPDFAPHVVGRYEPRQFDQVDGRWEEQRIELECEVCGARTEKRCDSGRTREHVARFALGHLHRDPFGPPAHSA